MLVIVRILTGSFILNTSPNIIILIKTTKPHNNTNVQNLLSITFERNKYQKSLGSPSLVGMLVYRSVEIFLYKKVLIT
jgi:hypothetical protein